MGINDKDKMDIVYFENVWQQSISNLEPAQGIDKANIMIFSQEDTLKKYLADSYNGNIVLVKKGNKFEKLNTFDYIINPANQDDYSKLICSLISDNIVPNHTIHAWNLEMEESEEINNQSVYSMLYLTQALSHNKIYEKLNIIYLYEDTCSINTAIRKAVSGFMKVAQLENPSYHYKMIGLTKESDNNKVVLQELANAKQQECDVIYGEHQRFIKSYQEINLSNMSINKEPVLKKSGVYVITGGTGGLGKLFANYLLQNYQAKIILLGRNELSEENMVWYNQLKADSKEVTYIKADISVKEQMKEAFAQAKELYGVIHGILHCAGTLQDSYVINKTTEEFQRVIQPKIAGTVILDEVTKEESLDFIALFSSITSVKGNVGQCDYAYANDFLNHFSEYRNDLYKQGLRKGKTISIDWPLWEHGGMQVSSEEKEALLNEVGIAPLPDEQGIKAFEAALISGRSQFIVAYGERKNVISLLIQGKDKSKTETNPIDYIVDEAQLKNKTEHFLKQVFSKLLQMPEDKIKKDITMQEYGMDSVMVSQFNLKMEQEFGTISKTLLYECQTLEELEQYLYKNHKNELVSKFHLEKRSAMTSQPTDVIEKEQSFQWENLESFITENNSCLRKLQTKCYERAKDIAIIGVGGKYPQADTIEEYWKNLKEGKDCITEIPTDRWNYEEYYDSDYQHPKPGKSYCKWGGFLKDVDKFDPLFFKLSPAESAIMDPQERLLLEIVWEVFEDAGYAGDDFQKFIKKYHSSNIGVFIGATNFTYLLWGPEEWKKGNYISPNSFAWSIANRISYVFNLSGPSMTVDTACSSSLTAIHQACESIIKGECETAIAGGVNLYLHPYKYVQMCQVHMLSPTGKCHSFGNEGNGFVPGEGVGAILLKPLDKAIADHDHIYAVIKGTSVNHGGKTSGYTVPNPLAQESLIEEAIIDSGIDPRTISYIEAHGTGTILGDPIEVSALTKAFRKYTEDTNYCSIGSVKSNIGHLEAAAGIAGITKLLLQMKYKQLVPSIHAEILNPNIDFEHSAFYFQKELSKWNRPKLLTDVEYPLRAGISSFGAGGSNAHVILEEYISSEETAYIDTTKNKNWIITLSAQTEIILNAYVQKLILYFEEMEQESVWDEIRLCDIAYTLCIGRKCMEERLAIIASSKEDLMQKLKAYVNGEKDLQNLFRGNSSSKSLLKEYFEVDDDVKEMFDKWMKKGKLEKIAAMWADGVEVDWRYLLGNHAGKRISLPTYPFKKKSYWIELAKDDVQEFIIDEFDEQEEVLCDAESPCVNPILYTTQWQLLKEEKRNENESKKSIWIITNEAGEDLENALKKIHQNDKVTTILLSDINQQISIDRYLMKKTDSDIMEDIVTGLTCADSIYFLGGIQKIGYDLGDLEKQREYEQTGVLTLFSIIKAISKRNVEEHSIAIKVVTNNLYHVIEEDSIQPFTASIVGFIKSAVKEYSFLKLSYVDISLGENPYDYEKLAQMIRDEAIQKKDQDIAIRNGKRFGRNIFPIELEQCEKSTFHENGVYVIIGGLGSIGYDLASYLLRSYHAKLTLVGRSSLDDEREKKLTQIKNLGGSVLYVSADVSKLEDIQTVIEKTEEQYGCIHGIIHSAMVFQPRNIAELNTDELIGSLKSKTVGSINLYQAVKDKQLDFLLFFSSGQSLTGNAYRSHYAAACTFEDAYALAMADILPFDVKIINWSFWATVNGKALDSTYNDYIRNQGAIPIDIETGMQIIEQVLKSNGKQVFTFQIKEFVQELMGIDSSHQILIPAKKNSKSEEPLKLDDFEKFVPEQLDEFRKVMRLASILLLKAFWQQNVFVENNWECEIGTLKKQLDIIPDYSRLFEELIRILAREAFIRKEGNKIITNEVITSEALQNEVEQCENKVQELIVSGHTMVPYIRLLHVCIKDLWQILKGEKPATEVLFPNSSMSLVEQIYKGNKMADYFNRLMVQAIKKIVLNKIGILSKGEKIRILEIGAGTGGASALILESLKDWKEYIEYYYTDLSASFTQYGKRTYGTTYDFIKFKVLDIEKNIVSQEFEASSFSIVIASNVLHATKEIRNTIRNAKVLLDVDGWLVLNEAVQIQDINTLTFGLTQGWWLYDDAEERLEGGPLLSTKMWKNILCEEGFRNVTDLATTDDKDYELIQNVIVAKSNGIIFMKKELDKQVENKQVEYKQANKVSNSLKNKHVAKVADIREYVEEIVIQCVSDTLSVEKDEIRMDKSFMDYGVDSILGSTVVNTINQNLNIELKSIELFDYSNIQELTQHIIAEYRSQIEQVLKVPEETDNNDDNKMLELFKKLENGEIDMEQTYQCLEVFEE